MPQVFLGEVNSGISSTQVVVKELKASASVQDQMQFLEEAQPYRYSWGHSAVLLLHRAQPGRGMLVDGAWSPPCHFRLPSRAGAAPWRCPAELSGQHGSVPAPLSICLGLIAAE